MILLQRTNPQDRSAIFKLVDTTTHDVLGVIFRKSWSSATTYAQKHTWRWSMSTCAHRGRPDLRCFDFPTQRDAIAELVKTIAEGHVR